jgi:hypothetical protein
VIITRQNIKRKGRKMRWRRIGKWERGGRLIEGEEEKVNTIDQY